MSPQQHLKILSHEWKPGSSRSNLCPLKNWCGRWRNQDWYNWLMLQTNRSLTQQLNKNLYNLVRRVKEDSFSSCVEDAVVHAHSLLSRQMWPHVKKYQLVAKWETKRFVPSIWYISNQSLRFNILQVVKVCKLCKKFLVQQFMCSTKSAHLPEVVKSIQTAHSHLALTSARV